MDKYNELSNEQLLVGWFAAYQLDNRREYDKFNEKLNERGI